MTFREIIQAYRPRMQTFSLPAVDPELEKLATALDGGTAQEERSALLNRSAFRFSARKL